MLKVELVYSTEGKNLVQLQLTMQEGDTVLNALEQSDMLKQYPEIQNRSFGVFSKPVSLDYLLKQGDRIEIYRPLTINPMEKRRQRAKLKKMATIRD